MKKQKRPLSFIMAAVLVLLLLPNFSLLTSAAMPKFSGTSISDGWFYIENADAGKYMQIDDGQAPNYNASGAFMELWGYNGQDQQRWRIVSLSNGYYHIISAKSGLFLSVQSNYLNKSGKSLVQEANTGEARQQWSITQTSRGTYVIRPRSGASYSKDWCMCAGSNLFGITDGLNVEQKEYEDDNSLKDEWYLYNVYDVSLLGFYEDTTNNRQAYFSDTRGYYAAYSTTNIYTEYYTTYTVADMIQCMQRSRIFYVHTHANPNEIQISRSGLMLHRNHLSGVDLSNTEFVFLLTCSTAGTGYNQANVNNGTPSTILEQIILCGAETAIGFTGETSVEACNWLAEVFTNYTLDGFDLEDLREFVNPEDLEGLPPFEILNVQQAVNVCVRSGRFTETTSVISIGGNPYKYLG